MKEDWIEIEIQEVAKLYQPKTISSKMLIADGEFPVYGANGIIGSYNKYNHENKELLITCRGATCGNVHITQPYSWINGNAMVVKPYDKKLLSIEYLKFVFSNKGRVQKAISGSAQPQITRTSLSPIKIPLAPLPIQRAIVSKIETLFSGLDAGIASLKKAQEQLKIYRQAVLKKAFEGELTKKWREEIVKTNGRSSRRADILPSAEELLQQIKEERQKHYEQQLEEWKKAVKTQNLASQNLASQLPKPKKPAKPKKPKELPPLTEEELKELPKLPVGWLYNSLGNIIEEPKYGSSKKCDYKNKGLGVLRIPNISDKIINTDDLKFAEFTNDEIEKYKLKENDILVIRSNGSVDLVGKCAIIKKHDEKYLYAGYLIRLRPLLNIINANYLLHCLSSINLRIQIESKAKSTSGVNNINSNELSSLIIPFCSIEEQHQIVQEIEKRLSVCDKMEQSINESLKKAEALRQSILKKAFEGELLSEAEIEACKKEPDYEPASVLLKKIKAEKLRKEQETKRSKKKEKK